jgi:capsular exopolysaccharide synthesis family protein
LPDFDIIFSGHFPPNPVELLSSPKFVEFLEKMKQRYNYIIIDTPPLAPVIDAAVISAHCDGAVLVVSPGKSKIKEAIAVKEQLLKSGCRILGAVVNQTIHKHGDIINKKRKLSEVNYETNQH